MSSVLLLGIADSALDTRGGAVTRGAEERALGVLISTLVSTCGDGGGSLGGNEESHNCRKNDTVTHIESCVGLGLYFGWMA